MLKERTSDQDPVKPLSSPDLKSAAPASDPSWDGLTLEDYARQAALDEAEVWKRLRRGDLIGRTQRGRLYVYTSESAVPTDDQVFSTSPHEAIQTFGAWVAEHEGSGFHSLTDQTLPPLPNSLAPAEQGSERAEVSPRQGGFGSGGFLALSGERTATPEMALLLDHLSLAKEENREILRLTQHSIQKVTELTDKIVEMKDAVIEAKNAQIQALLEQLAAKDARISTLAQNNEDLEMLARTIASSASG